MELRTFYLSYLYDVCWACIRTYVHSWPVSTITVWTTYCTSCADNEEEVCDLCVVTMDVQGCRYVCMYVCMYVCTVTPHCTICVIMSLYIWEEYRSFCSDIHVRSHSHTHAHTHTQEGRVEEVVREGLTVCVYVCMYVILSSYLVAVGWDRQLDVFQVGTHTHWSMLTTLML